MDLPPPTTNNKKTDNRMKRHPELQPYVPSDRGRVISSFVRKGPISNGGGGSGSKLRASSSLTSSQTSNTNTTTSTNNTTSTTYHRVHAVSNYKNTKDAKPRTQQPIAAPASSRQISKTPLAQQQPQHPVPRKSSSQLSSNYDRATTATAVAPSTTETPKTTKPITKNTSASSFSSSSTSTSTTTTTNTPETPLDATVKLVKPTTIATPLANSTPTSTSTAAAAPAPAAMASAADVRNNSTFGVIESQLSEMSINERLYQSAASDLSQDLRDNDVSTTTNGDYHENHGSLFNDLEADLIAEGIVKTEPVTPKLSMSNVSGDQQDESSRRLLKRDEEKRFKAEEELRENARRMDEERQNRQSLIESILSKVNQSS